MIGYALRESFAGTVLVKQDDNDPGTEVPKFTGGVLHVDDHRTSFSVRDELDAHGGVIVAQDNDLPLIGALDAFPALKRVSVKQDDAEPSSTPYDGLSLSELRRQASQRGLEAIGNKPMLVERLNAADLRAAAGDKSVNTDPTPERQEG